MSIDDDKIIIHDDNEDFKNDDIYLKEDAFQKIFYPPFQRLESGNSVKSNDIYYSENSSVSKQNIDNTFQKKDTIDPMGDFIYNFNNLFISDNNTKEDILIEKDDINISFENFDKQNFNPNNLFNIDSITSLKEDDIAIILNGKEGKEEIQEVKIINTKTETIDKNPTPIKPVETEKPKKKIRGKRGPYKKKKKKIIKTKTHDICFPFTTGNDLLSNDASENKLKQYMNTIFRTNTYVTDSNGNKKKEKKQRKFKPDDIRKKIKVRFHKAIKNIINENLKKAGSTELFSFLPQYFISNISKKFNNQYMNMTYEELLKINFSELQNEYPNKACDKNQYDKNMKTLEYLEKNPEISELSGFYIVKKMKYRDIFKAYFNSAEFEKSIETLKEENENAEYIQEYFILSKHYVEYFINIDN